jgi:hypothetical protein
MIFAKRCSDVIQDKNGIKLDISLAFSRPVGAGKTGTG